MANDTTRPISTKMNICDTVNCLAELPWHYLTLKNFRFAIKYLICSSSYDVLVTDSVSMWRETLNGDLILSRNNKLNPNIETPVSRLLHHLEETIANSSKEITLDVLLGPQNELTMTSHSSLSGYAFRWEFHLAPVDQVMFSEQLTKPLVVMVAELSRRQQEMFKILESKDAQIDDYKAEGVKLSRRYKDDKPFDKSKFSLEMVESKEFAELVKNPEKVAFNRKTQELYSVIAKHISTTRCNTLKQNYGCSSNDDFGSKKLEDKDNPAASSIVRPTPSTDEVPSPISEKDLELERRKKLKLKLEEDKLKKEVQRKKKKLNL